MVRIAGILAIGGAIVGVAYAVFTRGGPQKTDAHEPHASSSEGDEHVNQSFAQLTAMADAPEGKSPCDTCWIALQAEKAMAKQLGVDSIFVYVAPHDEFMQRCEALPKEAQLCMQPRYTAQHRDECARIRPPAVVLDAMRKLRPDLEEAPAPSASPGGWVVPSAPPSASHS